MSSSDSPRDCCEQPAGEHSGLDGGTLTPAREPRYLLYPGDCREVLGAISTESIDAIVTDPPYQLTAARPGGRSAATRGPVMRGFMGLAWDATGIAYDPALWRECLRAMKPGAHLLAFGGTRTAHRMVCAIEDAGFEIRDSILWIYGSGFPKSKNLTGERQGWGSALKPAHEPIVLARKPLAERTLEANVTRYGTGALNIDACRVPAPEGSVVRIAHFESGAKRGFGGGLNGGARVSPQRQGRWPANVIHDGSDEVLGHFPEALGQLAPARNDGEPQRNSVYGPLRHVTRQPELVLFGVRAFFPRTLAAGRRQVNFLATRKREHSRKPDELYPIIEACSPGPFLELFARRPRPRWAVWGAPAYYPAWPTYSNHSQTRRGEDS